MVLGWLSWIVVSCCWVGFLSCRCCFMVKVGWLVCGFVVIMMECWLGVCLMFGLNVWKVLLLIGNCYWLGCC